MRTSKKDRPIAIAPEERERRHAVCIVPAHWGMAEWFPARLLNKKSRARIAPGAA